MRSPHTSYRWRGERGRRANQVYALTTPSYRWRGERVVEPIKCMLSPHTSYRWRGERVIESIKCMLSPHTSYRWRGERVVEPINWMGMIKWPWLTRASGGNLARTPGLHPYSVREEPTKTTRWAPPAGFTNTSSNSNVVFSGGLPSRYWPGSSQVKSPLFI